MFIAYSTSYLFSFHRSLRLPVSMSGERPMYFCSLPFRNDAKPEAAEKQTIMKPTICTPIEHVTNDCKL